LKKMAENMNWSKQTPDKPLFPDVLWSRPENRRHAGKLLIIGGHKQEFNIVSEAYTAALKAGAGTVRVILPDSLQKMLHKLFPETEYAASTPIGSFSRQALGTLLDAADWADAVFLAGDLGRNSETAVLLEGFVEKYRGKLAMAGDSTDYFLNQKDRITSRNGTLLIANLGQLQKLAAPALIQQNSDFIKAIEQVSDWASQTLLSIVTIHSDKAIVAVKQQISTSPVKISTPDAALAAYTTVWWLQQPERPFEALTTAVYCYQQ
jgi:NAD(P)H-hydrate repair Nnr-like enzyme with NAD(P)H-hydrate dehydratase domain